MRKLYLTMILALAACVGFVAKAENFTITVVVDNENYLNETKAYYYDALEWDYVALDTWHVGENVFNYDTEDEFTLTVGLRQMYDWDFEQSMQFTKVIGYAPGDEEGTDISYLFEGYSGIEEIMLPFYEEDIDWDGVAENFNGWKIVFEMASYDELYGATAYLFTDRYDKVNILVGDYFNFTPISLEAVEEDEPHEIKFNTRNQWQWIISHVDEGSEIFYVECDGVAAEMTENGFTIYPEDNSIVMVTVDAPDYDCTVSLNVNEEGKNAIQSVTVNDEEVDWSAPFSAKPGNYVTINVDTDAYNVSSLQFNGEDQNTYGSFFQFRILEENNEISLTANPWTTYNVNLTVNDPAAVQVLVGKYSSSASTINITESNQTITVSENAGVIFIKPADGYVLNSLSYTTTMGVVVNSISKDYSGYYKVDASSGTVASINIETGIFVRDNAAWVYIDNPSQNGFIIRRANNSILLEQPGWNGGNQVMTEGYNRIEFASSEVPLTIDGYSKNLTPVVIVNGEVSTTTIYNSLWGFNGATLPVENNDVVKIYFDIEPQLYNVTFNFDGVNADEFDIVADKVVAVDCSTGYSCHTNTEIAIQPKSATDCIVKVDGTNCSAEDGKYLVNVSDNHVVNISSASGIEEIDADASEPVYYNLQGVRINGKPATGIYVKVTGSQTSKVIVK